MAELPSPCRGIDSSSPTSPQHISAIDITEARLAPFLHAGRLLLRLLVTSYAGGARALGRAGLGEPVDHRGEHVELLGVRVLGAVVLAGDRSQHVHGDLVRLVAQRAGTSSGRRGGSHQTSTLPSITPIALQVAVPPLHRVLLDVAVAAEQLHAVEADPHPLVGAELARERDLAGEVLAGGRAGGGLPGDQPHRLQLDRDVGDHERDRLPVGDRLAERLALLDVRRHVVEHGLAGADRERAPREPREPHALGVRRPVGLARAARSAGTRTPSSASRVIEAARSPIAGSPSTVSPSVPPSTRNSAGCAVELGADHEQLGLGAARAPATSAPSSTKPSPSRTRGRRRRQHVEQHGAGSLRASAAAGTSSPVNAGR